MGGGAQRYKAKSFRQAGHRLMLRTPKNPIMPIPTASGTVAGAPHPAVAIPTLAPRTAPVATAAQPATQGRTRFARSDPSNSCAQRGHRVVDPMRSGSQLHLHIRHLHELLSLRLQPDRVKTAEPILITNTADRFASALGRILLRTRFSTRICTPSAKARLTKNVDHCKQASPKDVILKAAQRTFCLHRNPCKDGLGLRLFLAPRLIAANILFVANQSHGHISDIITAIGTVVRVT